MILYKSSTVFNFNNIEKITGKNLQIGMPTYTHYIMKLSVYLS